MLTVYRDIKKFCTDVMHPYVCAIDTIVKADIIYLQEKITEVVTRLNTEVNNIRNFIAQALAILVQRLTDAETEYSEKYSELSTEVNNHVVDYSNPHNLNVSNLTTISAVVPDPAQGLVGDTWLQYEPLYSMELGMNKLSSMDIANIRAACLNMYLQDPAIAMAVLSSGGNLGSQINTYLTNGSTGVVLNSVAFNRLNQNLQSLSVDISNLPRYFDGTQIRTMTLNEFISNFIAPIGALGFNPYLLSTAYTVTGYDLVSSIPVFSDTRAVSGTSTHITVAEYYLHRKKANITLNINDMTSIINFATPVNMATQFLKLVKYVLLNTVGYRLRYNINGDGTTLGTIMTDTRLNSQQKVTVPATQYSYGYTYYRPYGSAITISSYAFKANVT